MIPPQVSFILTCFNLQHYVEAAIRSLLAQEGEYTFEIIVIDDCSTDDSVAVIESIQDERIRFIPHTHNRGAAASINEAFALARGKYIGRFDADDVWLPHFLNTTVPLLENNPELGLVYGDISIIDNQGLTINPHNQIPDYNDWGKSLILEALMRDYLICAPAMLARREAWELSLPLPEYLLYCDFEMALALAANWKIHHIPVVLAEYRIHNNNMHFTAIRHRKAENSIFDTLRRFQDRYNHIVKPNVWKSVLEERYLRLADQYFGVGEIKEARRCYWSGAAYRHVLQHPGYFRRWCATFFPSGWYQGLKAIYKTILPSN